MTSISTPDGPPTTRLVLIRHGETEWNAEGRYQGQADPALTIAGLRQASVVARRLGRARLGILYSSPLRRAWIPPGSSRSLLGMPVRADPRLMEIHLGRWQGMLHREIVASDPELFAQWHSAPWDTTPPGGERLEQVRDRVYAAIDDILASHPGQRVGVVTHRIPIILLCMRYLGAPAGNVHTLRVPNAGWVAMDLRNGQAVGQPRLSRRTFVDAAEQPLV